MFDVVVSLPYTCRNIIVYLGQPTYPHPPHPIYCASGHLHGQSNQVKLRSKAAGGLGICARIERRSSVGILITILFASGLVLEVSSTKQAQNQDGSCGKIAGFSEPHRTWHRD